MSELVLPLLAVARGESPQDGPGYGDVRRPAHGGQRHQIRLAEPHHRGNRPEKGKVYDEAIGRLGSMTPKSKQIVE